MAINNDKPIGIIGAGWVGLVTAACLAELGNHIIVQDIDKDKVQALNSGKIGIHEPDLAEMILRNKNRIIFTSLLETVKEKTEVIFVCVDTPPANDGTADLSKINSVIKDLQGSTDHILVMKSTVPSGTGNKIKKENPEIRYVSCPEFLREGSAVADFLAPDRVVIGANKEDKAAGEKVGKLYEILGKEIIFTDLASAEMIKHAANAFLATKISFINEIANICEKTGADVDDVARGIGADSRIGKKFLNAGIGYGGSCFPKDVSALKMLAKNLGYDFQILEAVMTINEIQKRKIIGKLTQHLGSLANKRVALLGLSFKPNTDDMREAPSIVISKCLKKRNASVVAYDPFAQERAKKLIPEIEMTKTAEAAIDQAEAVIIVTEWEEFQNLPWENLKQKMKHPLIIDGRNCLDKKRLLAAGFLYEGIGR